MALTRHCSACGGERRFEQPPCADGHGADCPEWACVDCGMAILIGDTPEPPVIARAEAA
ncbi:hypothetical protein GCM10023196_047460 [Actinoallomurus vinaceus]|uniref:Uncharacterized protein n=1 Tax=Actinoallomurus vinaceus TaxID=1080074 RepID=A0ABP8UCI3_9ACTN